MSEQTIVSPEEQPILESLVAIRNRLGVLKKDRNNYYKAADVVVVYEKVKKQVDQLLSVRQKEEHDYDEYHNRVDTVLDDVFQLLSLFWMALGKNRELPATYVQLVTMKQCLSNMELFGVYSQEDITAFSDRLQDIEGIIKQDKVLDTESPHQQHGLNLLVSKKLGQCQNLLNSLQGSLENMDNELVPTHKYLLDLSRELAIISARGNYDLNRVREIQDELREIDGSREEGKFVGKSGAVLTGQAQVVGLLERCYDMIHDIQASNEIVAESLKPIHERLEDIKIQLQKLVLTHRWTLRETDLWAYQIQLNEIDALRQDGYFYDEEKNIPEGQAVLNFLLQKCYRLVYHLLSSSEPIAEPLMPIHNQLITLRTCLLEVKKWGGPFTARELYPYQLKLASIDNLRIDGKFLDEDRNVPEGQAIVMSLLNECYDIVYELKACIDD
ncbi:hypothetical protein K493DRAFT_317986 [Basidiobolus meristosporus CBS 931.73]|uniref:Uncharacterized protein n=1 Tax=Basidiobolus meristosporus CBS 931.73 TaxID=1314790 RepID=A0A1Y1XXE4_9FUNG|nr:hypothetical protein K493DRAFT_317986 [Basidiobolus meristosporus CBS 931.73]|eukprot:ORX90418.1 hypothetical protein K493DRAFT_317986 [Basidiobolus meristosporus CBS 931.73]